MTIEGVFRRMDVKPCEDDETCIDRPKSRIILSRMGLSALKIICCKAAVERIPSRRVNFQVRDQTRRKR